MWKVNNVLQINSASTRATQTFHSGPIRIHRGNQFKWKKYTFAFGHKAPHDYVSLKVENLRTYFHGTLSLYYRSGQVSASPQSLEKWIITLS